MLVLQPVITFSQFEQMSWPMLSVKVPGEHSEHSEAPPWPKKVPTGHSVHEDERAVELYLPCWHGVQLSTPRVLAKEPARNAEGEH